jgi:hypothetical protein
MQDIATALKTAINQWEIVKEINAPRVEKWEPNSETYEQHVQLSGAVPTAKQPVAHTIFNYVRDNPGMTAAQYTDKLSEKGLIRGSVSSYIYQMISTKLLYADADKKLYTKHKEYKTTKQLPKQAKPPTQRKAKPAPAPATVSVPQTATSATPAPAVVRTVHVQQKPDTINNDVERILSMLNVRTAHKLCEALNKIFKA